MQWVTDRCDSPLLGLWSPDGTVPEKLGSQVTPGHGRCVGLRGTLTDSLQTGQRISLCEKQGACQTTRHKQGESTKKKKKSLSAAV